MKNNQMHIVLGGAGGVGNAVLRELENRGIPAKTVERSKEVSGVHTIKADLLDLDQTIGAIA
jgi:uncharacterized protein YbjT (DUF2867 family)